MSKLHVTKYDSSKKLYKFVSLTASVNCNVHALLQCTQFRKLVSELRVRSLYVIKIPFQQHWLLHVYKQCNCGEEVRLEK